MANRSLYPVVIKLRFFGTEVLQPTTSLHVTVRKNGNKGKRFSLAPSTGHWCKYLKKVDFRGMKVDKINFIVSKIKKNTMSINPIIFTIIVAYSSLYDYLSYLRGGNNSK